MRRIVYSVALILIALTVCVVGAHSKGEFSDAPRVRVAIAREAREITLAVEGEYDFRDLQGKVISKGPRFPKTTIRLLDKGIAVGLNVYAIQSFLIEPLQDATILINNRRFRGNIRLIRTANNRLTAVNSIDLEDYIKGVLYHEVSHHWPMEALKAQAVATRTYALYAMTKSVNKEYDVTNDIYSQVYGGQDSERYRTGLAVERTKGEVLIVGGKILPAYFHAACAGMTEDANEMWGMDNPALKGIPCTFCADSPHMNWKRNFRLKDIQDKLTNKGYAIGLIKAIKTTERNRSNRTRSLTITDRNDTQITMSGKEFRDIIGPNEIRSNNYDIVMQGYFVDIVGHGWGHGVGLCQWGARGMAIGQFNYKQILSYYYPTSQLLAYGDFVSMNKKASKTNP